MLLRREILLLFDTITLALECEEFADISLRLQRRIALRHGMVGWDCPLQLAQHGPRRAQILRRACDRRGFLSKRVQIGRPIGAVLSLRAHEHLGGVPRLTQQWPIGEFAVDAPQLQSALRKFALQRPGFRFLQTGVEPKQHLSRQHRLTLGHGNFDNRSRVSWLDDLETGSRCQLALGNRDNVKAPEHQPQRCKNQKRQQPIQQPPGQRRRRLFEQTQRTWQEIPGRAGFRRVLACVANETEHGSMSC